MDYHFTDGNDTIVATNDNGFEEGDRIFGGDGDDYVILGPDIFYVSEAGNDTIIAQAGGALAFWFDQGPSEINLATGVVKDAHGGTDTVSGITQLHLSNFGADIIGSDLDERVFYFGGDSDIDLGGGDGDTLVMYQKTSDLYQLSVESGGLRLTGEGNNLFLRGVEQIEFTDRSVNTEIVGSTLYAEFRSNAWSFTETEIAPGYTYAGVYTDSQVVSHFVQEAKVLDLDGDGDLDFFANMSKGYRANIDTRGHFVVLENRDGKLVYNQAMSEMTPFITGSRRIELLELAGRDTPVMVSVAHDTAAEGETRFDIPWRLGDIAVIGTQPFEDLTAQVIPRRQLPHMEQTGRDTAVDAHSLATGDVNGDGLEDIVVGDLSAGPFVLLQTASGTFTFEQPDFFKRLHNWFEPTFPDATEAFLLDLHMADLNGDGFDDLVAGWGHGKVLGRVFFNDGSGAFSLQASTTLPVAIYGNDNALHMETHSADFDRDGDLDLVILQVRNEPWYSGNYLQFLENDGSGNFMDRTAQRFGDPADQSDTFGSRLMWTDKWQVIDVNGDGFLDILGHHVSGSQTPLLWLNLGNGAFTRLDIPTNTITGHPLQWADFDGDGELEFISFNSSWTDGTGTASTNQLSVYELAASAFDSQSHQLGQTAGDDELRATSQNDLIDGMEGTDTVVFSNASTDAILQINTDGKLTLIDRNGTGGTDSLKNVEVLQFSDRTLDLANFSSAVQLNQMQFTQLAEMYVAYFNRAPDAEGLIYWADKLAEGQTLDQIAEYFFDQDETRSIYTDPSDTDTFINSVYNNVLGRVPDASGFSYWKDQLENNAFTEGSFVLQIINGAKNNPDASEDVDYLATKAKLGLDYAAVKGLGSVAHAISVMNEFGDQVTSDLVAARNAIERYYIDAVNADSDFLIQLVGIVVDPFSVS